MTHDHIDTDDDDTRPTDTHSVETARCDWGDSSSVLEGILAAISDLDPEFDPTNSPTVQSAVDVDAVERLFEPAHEHTHAPETTVTFAYDSYTITVTAGGTVTATDTDSPHPYRSPR